MRAVLRRPALARTPDGPPPPPAVQRLRIHYAKRGRLRFTSHRDFQRAFERALRRADVPMAYSAGFNPHPKVSYVGASPTGVASEAEYLEIAVAHRCDPTLLREALDASLPPGLDVLDIVEARSGNLADRVNASLWQLRLDGVSSKVAQAAVETFLAADRIEVERLLKDGRRTLDARSPVISLGVVDAVDEPPCAILQMVVRHVTPAVRPDDVLTGLREVADLVPPVPSLVTRLAQGLLDEETGQIADPLAPDRETAAATSAVPETP